MANFIASVVSRFTSSEPTFPADVPFIDDDPCNGCQDPCNDHPQLPGYLQKKIEGGPLINTMKPYKKHIMVFEGVSRGWRERLEEADSFTTRVDKAVDEVKGGIRTIVTAADRMMDEGDGQVCQLTKTTDPVITDDTSATIVVFPELLQLMDVKATAISSTVEALLLNSTLPPSVRSVPLEGNAWIFVCTHKKRDKRCGVAGPMLVNEFRTATEEMGLDEQVQIFGCSHFGGHKFAGNIIIYHRDPVVDGNWYGRVRTCHVRPILQSTIKEGKIFRELWRGRMEAHERPGTIHW
ncbi:Sucrase/ferredoxin-like-domain-containing protein [Phlyctochytrium arcticum]|nr:Sucrase/ferredoxin-like-domain-containing protein [Phlyctochytrium arcticum]